MRHFESHVVCQYISIYHLISAWCCSIFTYQCIILQWSKKNTIEQVNFLLVINEVKHCNQPTIKKYLLRDKMLIFREIQLAQKNLISPLRAVLEASSKNEDNRFYFSIKIYVWTESLHQAILFQNYRLCTKGQCHYFISGSSLPSLKWFWRAYHQKCLKRLP